MAIETLVGLVGSMLVILAGFWTFIERTFVRRDVQKQKDVATDERNTRLESRLDEIQLQGRKTHEMVMTELPRAVQQACILGVTEGAKIVRTEVRAARSTRIQRLPIRKPRTQE